MWFWGNRLHSYDWFYRRKKKQEKYALQKGNLVVCVRALDFKCAFRFYFSSLFSSNKNPSKILFENILMLFHRFTFFFLHHLLFLFLIWINNTLCGKRGSDERIRISATEKFEYFISFYSWQRSPKNMVLGFYLIKFYCCWFSVLAHLWRSFE